MHKITSLRSLAPLAALSLALAGCVFDTTPLDTASCESDANCADGFVCSDGFCTVDPDTSLVTDLADGDTDAPDGDDDTDAPDGDDVPIDLDDTDPPDDLVPDDTRTDLVPALTVLDAELLPPVVAPGQMRTITVALRVQRGTRTGTNLLLLQTPAGVELDDAAIALETFDGAPLEIDLLRDGRELQLALDSVLPDGRYRLELPATIADDAPATLEWSLRAAPADPVREDWVDARAADVDPEGGSDSLVQSVRRLFASGVAELVPVGPGFSPRVFVAASTLDTDGLFEPGVPDGTLHIVLDEVPEPGLDRLAIDLVAAAAAAPALTLEAVRVEGAVRHLVGADPSPLQAVAVAGDTSGEPTLTLELGAPMVDLDGDGRLAIELDLRLESPVAASGSFELRAWDSAVADIVRDIPAGDATPADGRNALDYEVWAWVQRYGRDFASDADHDFLANGTFDGWAAFAEGNGRARITGGRLTVDNYVFEASGTTVLYRDVPGYVASHPLRVSATLAVSMNDNTTTNSPNGTSFYFGAFAETAELSTFNGTNDTTPAAGYGAWVFSGRHNGSVLVSGHWGIVDSLPTSHRADLLAGSVIDQPATHLDWSATQANARRLLAVWGGGGALDVWLTPLGQPTATAPTMSYRASNAGGSGPLPVHAASGNVFFEMTDEGVAAIERVRFDELVPPE